MDYQEFVFIAQKILKYEATDTTFTDMLPRMIEYTEERIYIDFDFLCTLTSQTALMTASNRNVTLPSNIIVAQSLNAITPFTAASPDLGTRNPLTRVGVEYINALYPDSTSAGLPVYYAIIGLPTLTPVITAGSYNILLGPFPDQAYPLETIGTVRPAPLSPTNTTTFIATYLPHLYVAGAMVFGFGYQRDFGAQSDATGTAQSWEAQYNSLKAGANVEQLRAKAASVSWSPYQPTPTANVSGDHASAPA